MKHTRFLILMSAILATALPAPASVIPVAATDITIFDNLVSGSPSTWYNRGNTPTGASSEDNEVEPGTVTGDVWDLEGFYLSGSKLFMVGTYDFVNGQDGWTSGDLFIDVNGDASYGAPNLSGGSGNSFTNNTFGYDYVLKLDFNGLAYQAYDLQTGSPILQTVYYPQNIEANPWRFEGGGQSVGGLNPFTYHTGVSDADAKNLTVVTPGVKHNVVELNLAPLTFLQGKNILFHFTMECGNDNLMGYSKFIDRTGDDGTDTIDDIPVPEPATLTLLGLGLLGLGVRMARRSPIR